MLPVHTPETADAWLAWPGRRWVPRGGRDCSDDGPTFKATEWIGERSTPPRDAQDASRLSRLVHGDALDIARALMRDARSAPVDLVYVDPPFASQAAYVHEARLDGPADGRVLRAHAYDDRWGDGIGPYLDMLAPRLEALCALLADHGTIWVHVDWRASYLVRLLLDEILGRAAFRNEIVWKRAPNLGRQAASNQFGRTLDTILVYGGPAAKIVPPKRLERVALGAVRWDEEGRPFTSAPRGDYTDASIRRLEKEGRVHRTASGRVYVKYFLVKDSEGQWCRERRVDALWTDVPPLRHVRTTERTGFPTQKPRALLDRIVSCASPPGGLVVDLFAGSGTTGESAQALGRRFVIGDESALAIATARARLLRAGSGLVVEACGRASQPPDGEGARVQVDRTGRGVRVRLIEPREPLAWAVDAAHDPGGPFRVAWHSERAPAARAARAALLDAMVEDAPGPVAVRVWYDDGRVCTRTTERA